MNNDIKKSVVQLGSLNQVTPLTVMLSALLNGYDPLWPLHHHSLNCAGSSDSFRSHRLHKQTCAEPKLQPPNPP